MLTTRWSTTVPGGNVGAESAYVIERTAVDMNRILLGVIVLW
jgi:hypothetical protein